MYHPNPVALKQELKPLVINWQTNLPVTGHGIAIGAQLGRDDSQGCQYEQY
jgi:hypothetical protein